MALHRVAAGARASSAGSGAGTTAAVIQQPASSPSVSLVRCHTNQPRSPPGPVTRSSAKHASGRPSSGGTSSSTCASA